MFSRIISVLFVFTFITHAQFRWTAGGPNSDESHSVIQTPDGGFAIAGNNQMTSLGKNGYVVKLSSSGSMQWNKSIGGVAEDAFYTIIRTSDGGYALAGWTYSYGAGGFDYLVVKLNASGNLQWTKVIGGSNTDYGCSIVQTSDGGYVVAGHSRSFSVGSNNDILVTKLNSSGAVQWSRIVGWGEWEYGYSLIKTSDGGFAVAGSTESLGQGSYDLYIVKFNANGIPEWSRMIGGANSEFALSLIQSSDGNYVVAGSTMSFGAGGADMYIVKFGSTGTFMWSRTLGGSGYEFASSVVQTTDGGYIVTGGTETFGS